MPKWLSRLFFWLAYLRGRTPWDTNITPPELMRTIEGPEALPPGRALDLGCGTGTNAIYLARQGWDVVGVDFVDEAVRRARKKARAAGVGVRFYRGDVTRLEKINGLANAFDLVLDIGCLHSLPPDRWGHYAAGLAQLLRPGAIYLLYAHGSIPGGRAGHGISPERVPEILGPSFEAIRIERGEEWEHPAAWYWFTFATEN